MSRIASLIARYERSVRLMTTGVEIVAIGDTAGARFDAAVRQVLSLARNDTSGLWDDVLGAAKALRFRVMTQPQPLQFNLALRQGATNLAEEAHRLRPATGSAAQQVLDGLIHAADEFVASDPIAGGVVFESLQDVGGPNCVVIGANGPAVAGLQSWLGTSGFLVCGVGQLVREQLFVEQGYAIGPPRLFPSSLVTAPVTEALSYFIPGWYADRSIPQSEFTERAEGAVRVAARQFTVGDSLQAANIPVEQVAEEELLPQATWIFPDAPVREPAADEVAARRVRLSGGYAILLDDGEWIRAVDLSQRGGGRVTTVDVDAVRPGIYLLLRDGETERRALYDAALNLMGDQAQAVKVSQARWKGALQARLNQDGRAAVTRDLAKLGVRTLDRVAAWTDPMLARPRSNRDFELLLGWLAVPVHATYELATALRRKRAQASANIADQLEEAVGGADISVLERDGHLRLELDTEGFRGVIATRVLAVSPHVEVVSRHETRVLMEDRGAKWLE